MAENLADTNVGNIEYIRKDDAVDMCGGYVGLAHFMSTIKSADVVLVVHAHWIRHDDADVVEGYYVPEYECSKCGAWKEDDSDFCPDCGAKMDEEE